MGNPAQFDEMFLDDDFMWGEESGRFVQTRVRRLEEGPTDLRLMWADRIANSNNTNATDIHEVREGGGVEVATLDVSLLLLLLLLFFFFQ